jgi:hypothetical protein
MEYSLVISNSGTSDTEVGTLFWEPASAVVARAANIAKKVVLIFSVDEIAVVPVRSDNNFVQ